jgi:hypothetical protein
MEIRAKNFLKGLKKALLSFTILTLPPVACDSKPSLSTLPCRNSSMAEHWFCKPEVMGSTPIFGYASQKKFPQKNPTFFNPQESVLITGWVLSFEKHILRLDITVFGSALTRKKEVLGGRFPSGFA